MRRGCAILAAASSKPFNRNGSRFLFWGKKSSKHITQGLCWEVFGQDKYVTSPIRMGVWIRGKGPALRETISSTHGLHCIAIAKVNCLVVFVCLEIGRIAATKHSTSQKAP